MGWSPIHVAVACLPQGLVGLVMGGVTQFVPQIITKPRITMPVGALREFARPVSSTRVPQALLPAGCDARR